MSSRENEEWETSSRFSTSSRRSTASKRVASLLGEPSKSSSKEERRSVRDDSRGSESRRELSSRDERRSVRDDSRKSSSRDDRRSVRDDSRKSESKKERVRPIATLEELQEIALLEEKIKRKLPWKKRYETDIPIIDEQHKNFFIILGTIKKVCKKKKSEKFIRLMLEELVDYTKIHFKTEERVLRESGYPDFKAHQAVHNHFVATINEKVTKFSLYGEDVIDESFCAWLFDWLENHITVKDVHHCTYTKNQLKVQKDNLLLKSIINMGPPEYGDEKNSIPPVQRKLNQMKRDILVKRMERM